MRTRGYLVSDAVKRFGASPHLLVRASASASLADPRDLQLPENAAYSAFNFTSDNSVSHLLSRSQLQASCLGTPRTILVSNHLAGAVLATRRRCASANAFSACLGLWSNFGSRPMARARRTKLQAPPEPALCPPRTADMSELAVSARPGC